MAGHVYSFVLFVVNKFLLFNLIGRLFNRYGEISKPWWSNFTLTGFQNRSKCLVDQYNKYPLDVYGRKIFVRILNLLSLQTRSRSM